MIKVNRATSFNKNAEIYNEVRPPYPQEIYDEIQQHARLDASSTVLEIGAGHGVATEQMLHSWPADIIAIEPGEELYNISKEKFFNNPRVKLCLCTFEEYQPDIRFDCICAATAFHWVEPGIRYKKSAELLKNDGILALFWNNYSRNDEPIFDAIQEIYTRYHPDVHEAIDVRDAQKKKIEKRTQELETSEEFILVAHREYEHTKTYDADGFVKLLKTFSPNAIKKAGELDLFYEKMRELILGHGDSLNLPIKVNLEIGRKVPS